MAQRIQMLSEVAELVKQIQSPSRKRPICILTTPLGKSDYKFDSRDLEQDFEQYCDFYAIETGELTRDLCARLPEGQGVYGGAGRAYPIDFADREQATPLRYLNNPAAASKGERSLANDINGHAFTAGLIKIQTSSRAKQVTATVIALNPEWLMVKTSDGSMASMLQSTSFPGIPLEWIFREGQEIAGTLDPETNRFVLPQSDFNEQQLLEFYPLQTVTTGLVKSTNRKSAVIQVHPFLEFEVAKNRITGNERDVIDDYLKVGEVRLVRVYRDEQGRVGLRLDDIDDDEYEAPAITLFGGDQPWLQFGRDVAIEIEEELGSLTSLDDLQLEAEVELDELAVPPTKTGSIPLPGPSMLSGIKTDSSGLTLAQAQMYQQTIERLKGEMAAQAQRFNRNFESLKASAVQIEVERDEFARDLRTANTRVSELQKELSAARTEARQETQERAKRYPRRARFETVDDWFREELRRFWLIELKPAERKQWNLERAQYTIGPKFIESLDPQVIDEGELKKVLRIVMWLVLGRQDIDKIKKAHALTEGGAPVVREEDRAVCMRLYVEEKAPSAKRIHYFKSPISGQVDLLTLAVHDDYDY